ncbi:hypothetical protein LSH36_306g03003 [Paralvinella palmiformis]|uniref:PIH1 domain-containing protein 1 n=1 Tax=Paralvinella palmiformis TaxID=53620 RepID=A0AAD9JI52_9ANNE|nr:hypothetical protein LSH36_306g03003 [Paralvinella palmiformis]
MDNFLESSDDKLLQSLLIKASQEGDGILSDQIGSAPVSATHKVVVPKPGFCLKFKDDTKGEKIFINVCQADNLPQPDNISDEELLKILDSDDPSGFRVPMSIGEPHAEVDKGGKGCTAYDIVVHPNFLTRIQNSEVMLGFFITICIEGLEAKYNITLNRKWTILKNKKFIGSLPEQNIRTQSKPLIQDLSGESPLGRSPLISEVSDTKQPPVVKGPPPPYTIIQEPPEGHPDFLVAEMHLPKVKSAATLTLDVGEDRILLETRSNIYHLDIYLPYDILQEECAAQFNNKTKILTLTMPVLVS